MLEGKADLPSLQVFQAVVDVHVAEDVEDLANLRASLADAAIIAFGKHTEILGLLPQPLALVCYVYFAN